VLEGVLLLPGGVTAFVDGETLRRDATLGLQLLDAPDVDRTPDAALPARREADGPGGVAPATDGVDPPETQRFVESFLVGDALAVRLDLVKADPLLGSCGVVLLQPRPPFLPAAEE